MTTQKAKKYRAEKSFLEADFPDVAMYDLTLALTDNKTYTIEHTAKSVRQWGINRCAGELVYDCRRIDDALPTIAKAVALIERWLDIYG